MKIEITKVTVIRGCGTDKIALETNLKNGLYPYTGFATLHLEVANNAAEGYIETNFPKTKFTVINSVSEYKY